MALALTTITNSIAALTITGLKIYDIDEIPGAADTREHSLYPEPVEFLTNFTAVRAAFGTGATSKWNVDYDITYTLAYAPVGSERVLQNIGNALDLAMEIVNAILAIATLSGAVLLTFQGISTPGAIPDPSGNMHYGANITFHVLEFVN